MNQEEIKKVIESSEFKYINYKQHTKYLNDVDLILVTEYPIGIEIKPGEIGYSKDDNKRIISGKEV